MFKILSLEFFEHPFFGSLNIPFVQPEEVQKKNYISFVIGPNGTGKSKILLSLINIFNSLETAFNAPTKKYTFEYSYKLIFENGGESYNIFYSKGELTINDIDHSLNIEFLDLPRKVLISCFSFNDKYPLREQRGNVLFEKYHYLGLKSASNNIFIGNPTKAAIGNLYDALIANKDVTPLREAFKVLELEPEITLVYKRGRNFRFLKKLADSNRRINNSDFAELLAEFIREKESTSGGSYTTPRRLGRGKLENVLKNEQSILHVSEYLLKFMPDLLRTKNQELLIQPVLNFNDTSSYQVFAEHVLPLKLLSDMEIISFQRLINGTESISKNSNKKQAESCYL